MKEKKIELLIVLTALSAGILLIANLSATKLWNLFGISVDGGLVIFPLSYVIGDIIMELFGRKIANRVVMMGFVVNLLAVVVFWIVGILPEYAGWGLQEAYQSILGFAPRVIFASLVAYLLSGFLNNFVFEKIRNKTGEQKLWLRVVGSSAVAKICDTMFFETVAFLGVLSLPEFFVQAGFAYVAAVGIEAILMPVIYVIVRKMHEIYD